MNVETLQLRIRPLLVACIITIYTFSGGHIRWSPYLLATRLLASVGPVAITRLFWCHNKMSCDI